MKIRFFGTAVMLYSMSAASNGNAQTAASVIECLTENGRPVWGEYDSESKRHKIFKIDGNQLLKWSTTQNQYQRACDYLQLDLIVDASLNARPTLCSVSPATISYEWKFEYDFNAYWGDDVREMQFYLNINRLTGKAVFGWRDWFTGNPTRTSSLETHGQCKRIPDPAEAAPIF